MGLCNDTVSFFDKCIFFSFHFWSFTGCELDIIANVTFQTRSSKESNRWILLRPTYPRVYFWAMFFKGGEDIWCLNTFKYKCWLCCSVTAQNWDPAAVRSMSGGVKELMSFTVFVLTSWCRCRTQDTVVRCAADLTQSFETFFCSYTHAAVIWVAVIPHSNSQWVIMGCSTWC